MKEFLLCIFELFINMLILSFLIVFTIWGVTKITEPIRQIHEYNVTKKATVKFIDTQFKKMEEYAETDCSSYCKF